MSLEVMNKSELRDLMLRDKSFLARLYTSDNPLFTRKQIINAESNQLQLLIQILHYFSNGSIPLRAKDYKSICKSKKHGFIFKSFRSLENANKLLNESREIQTKALTKVSVCYPYLFFSLFNQQ